MANCTRRPGTHSRTCFLSVVGLPRWKSRSYHLRGLDRTDRGLRPNCVRNIIIIDVRYRNNKWLGSPVYIYLLWGLYLQIIFFHLPFLYGRMGFKHFIADLVTSSRFSSKTSFTPGSLILARREATLILGFVLISTLLLIALISVVNALTFPRLNPVKPQDTLSVSILVPARNEADRIVQTLNSLQRQSYPDFELIVLDDGSNDGTLEIVQKIIQGDARAQVISGQPLPPGWLGKNWACHQLAQEAKGELLVFTDADVHWGRQALSAVVSLIERSGADMLTVWPTQRTETWTERLVIPMMMFVVIGYLPEILVRHTNWPVFAAANGQCLAFRRVAYDQVDGHKSVRDNIIEDMGLAWGIKRSGLKLVMALGNRLIETRMYTNWQEVLDGFAKNILAGHGGQPLFLFLSAVFHWFLFLMPWIWLIAGLLAPDSPGWPWIPGTSILLGIGIRCVSAASTQQRIRDVIWLPLSVILMTIIAMRSLLWFFRSGGPEWKGRSAAFHS